MLNLEETLQQTNYYNIQNDFVLKLVSYFFPSILFLGLLRNQVPEMNILQLIPGSYFIFLFIILILLICFTYFVSEFSIQIDKKNKNGTKTLKKIILFNRWKFSFFLGCLYFFLSVLFLGPLSLDSFNTYTENSLENIWSFDEVLTLEFFLSLSLLILSQLPLISNNYFTTEKQISLLPDLWKFIIFFSFIIAGSITPTIDIYTQSAFAFSTIYLYLFFLTIIQKKINIKSLGITVFN